MADPRILIVGTGAVGGLYGGMLQRAGCRVETVCRNDLAVVRERGIRIQSIWGDFTFRPDAVYAATTEVDRPPDCVIVALKVLPEINLPGLLQPVVAPGTAIVLLQNGIEIEAPVAAAYPAGEIVSGLAFVCSNRMAPGVIHHLDYGRLTLGRYPDGASPAAELLATRFAAAGVPCTVSPDIVTARWQKLVWNAPFNPLSVLAGGVTTAELLDCPEVAELVERIMQEVVAVAAAAGAVLPETIVADMLRDTRSMKPYKTSMLLDYQAGRPMEVDAILGNAIRTADRLAVPAPNLRAVNALLKLADQRKSSRPG